MIPDWLKNEHRIHSMFKDLRRAFGNVYTGIDDVIKNYHMYIETGQKERPTYDAFAKDMYLNIFPGIETDNNNLKPISIIITNWERYYYIPLVLEMYHSQDYPKDLLEILIVDDNSTDKNMLLNTIKEQIRLYPDLKIRFIQNYINRCQNGTHRRNIGVRHASYNIVVLNETDTIPLGRNYLRGICYAHNKFENINCMGIAIEIKTIYGEEEQNFTDLEIIFDNIHAGSHVCHRFDNEYVPSFNKELFSKIRGFDEQSVGWGGHEGNIMTRYCQVGGKIAMNTSIYSAQLPNFPRKLPPGIIKRHTGGHWQEGIIINNENWGTTEKMEEINLYN